MVRREDFEEFLPEVNSKHVMKRLAQRKLLLAGCIVGIIALIIIIMLAALSGHCDNKFPTSAYQGSKDECLTPSCIHSAAWLADNMDTSVNPCDNFYKYACGGWERRNSISPDRVEVTIVEQLEEDIEEQLRKIIEKIPKSSSFSSDSLTAAEGKLQMFFRSCINDHDRLTASGEILVNKINSALKGWNILSSTRKSSQFNVKEAITATQADFVTDVYFSVHAFWDNTLKKNILGILPDYSWFYYNNPSTPEEIAYRNYIRAIGGMLLDDSNVTVNSSEKETRVEQFVNDVYRMEKDLNVMYKNSANMNASPNTMTVTVRQLQSAYPQINWGVILGRMFEGLRMNSDTLIRVYRPLFFRQLNNLLVNETQMHERDRILNNYFVWKIAFKYANDLSWKYREAYNNYMEAMGLFYETHSTWKTCLDTIHNILGSLLKYEFIKNHLSPDRKDEVTRMYTDIKQAVADRLDQLNIIDDETKTMAKYILESVIPKIGFSDIYYNQTLMAQLHSSLEITPTATYFDNLLSLVEFQRKQRIEFLLKSTEDPKQIEFDEEPGHAEWVANWVMPYRDVDSINVLRVPPGSMLEPLYNSKRPGVVNYGMLGTLLSIQLMSSFDRYKKRTYLKNGSYVSWWTKSMDKAYSKNVDCFKKYFDGIEMGPYLINGEIKTVNVTVISDYLIDQLITEFGGIRAAYNGYKKWLKDTRSKDPVPAGLDLTHDQLFFVSSVQAKCFLRRHEMSHQNAPWSYIPGDAQVNTLLSRMSEFSSAFNCPEGSKMKKESFCETL